MIFLRSYEPHRSSQINPTILLLRGGSAIIGPEGQYVVDPLFDEERTIVAELNFEAIDKGRMTLDVTGHYHRADLFELKVKSF